MNSILFDNGHTDWKEVRGERGFGSPVGVLLPRFVDELYQDASSGNYYRSTGLTVNDWVIISGGSSTGVQWGPDASEIILQSHIEFFDSIFDTPSTTSITFPNLVTLDDEDNGYNFQVNLNYAVVSYSFPELVEANVDNLDGGGYGSINSWSSPKLRNVRGSFNLDGNPLTFIDVSSLETVGSGLNLTGDSLLESISYDSLVSVESFFDMADSCLNLTSVSAPLLETTGDFFVGSCPLISSLVLPSYVSNGNAIYIFNNDTLASVSLPLLVDSGLYLTVASNPMLTTLNLPSYVPQDGATIDLTANALNATSVNAFLARCVANLAFVSGSIDLSGGTNSAPTGQGLTDKATLEGRGVTVTTN